VKVNDNSERDARNEAIWQVFMTPANREILAMLTGMMGDKEQRDRAYQDDMRRG
jgi:hypothetical protein